MDQIDRAASATALARQTNAHRLPQSHQMSVEGGTINETYFYACTYRWGVYISFWYEYNMLCDAPSHTFASFASFVRVNKIKI